MLSRGTGATHQLLTDATGWQPHTIRHKSQATTAQAWCGIEQTDAVRRRTEFATTCIP